jgi:hypothetical protein
MATLPHPDVPEISNIRAKLLRIKGYSKGRHAPSSQSRPKEANNMPAKNPLDMSNREWAVELQRINREGFIRRTAALDKAETEAAYARIRKCNPSWSPTPLPDKPEDISEEKE